MKKKSTPEYKALYSTEIRNGIRYFKCFGCEGIGNDIGFLMRTCGCVEKKKLVVKSEESPVLNLMGSIRENK